MCVCVGVIGGTVLSMGWDRGWVWFCPIWEVGAWGRVCVNLDLQGKGVQSLFGGGSIGGTSGVLVTMIASLDVNSCLSPSYRFPISYY